MTLRVTNSLTGNTEEFVPRDPDNVLLYYCGLTVSDYPHLGHARSWVHVDVIRRWLEYLGYQVRHIENFTDVNEKIVARIGEADFGDSESEIARYFITQAIRDMRSLNLRRAHAYPRVSEHIPQIISLIETLLEGGYAYESGGSVYFDVSTFDGYGELSNQRLEHIEAQGNEGELAEKRHPADFALWKSGAVTPESVSEHRSAELEPLAEPDGQTWKSPWGDGRPGWHIECSAMSMTHLDDHIDIHVGGQDLVFPHHENEIAQSEAASDEQFATYWLHIGLLETEGEKMSSSLQNYFAVRNAIKEFGSNEIRMFLLSSAYRQLQSYTEESLHEAIERWDRLSRTYSRARDAADSPAAYATVCDDEFRVAVHEEREAFTAAMNDDFNTREALRALFDLATAANRHLDHSRRYDYQALRMTIEAFTELGDVLGFSFTPGLESKTEGVVDGLVKLVLEIREEEREAGNWDRADDLRDRLRTLGITIEDSEDGPTYQL